MLRHFTLAVLMSLVLVLPGQIAADEDDNEPPVSQSENDPAFTDKQPVDPVAIEKMATGGYDQSLHRLLQGHARGRQEVPQHEAAGFGDRRGAGIGVQAYA